MPEEVKTFEQMAEATLETTQANDSLSQSSATPGEKTPTQTAVAAGDEQGASEQSQPPEFIQRLSELGFADIADEETARQRLLDAYTQEKAELEELRQQMEYIRLQSRFGQQNQPSQQVNQPAQAQTQVQPQQPRNYWEIQVDEARTAPWMVRGEDGEWQLKPETPADVRGPWEAREIGKQQFVKQFVENPSAAIAPFLQQQQQAMEEKFRQMLKGVEQEKQRETAMNQFVEKNPWIYQIDPVTNSPRVGGDGAPILSDAGMKLDAILTEFINRGLPEDVALEAAQGIYATRYGAVNQQATKQAIAQNRLAHITNGNAAAAARNGHSSAVGSGKLQGSAAGSGFSFEERFADLLGS